MKKKIQELNNIAKKIKETGKHNKYDCIVGISGGTDSSYMLHYLVTKLDLKPLVFHVDGGWNTSSAVINIKNLITKLKVDLKVKVIDWEEMKLFQLALFKSGVCHLDTAQDQAFLATLYHYASKNNIKYIFNGGNISTENVDVPLDWIYYTTDLKFIKNILKKFLNKRFKNFEFSSIINHKINLRYLKGIKVIRLLNYIPTSKKMH